MSDKNESFYLKATDSLVHEDIQLTLEELEQYIIKTFTNQTVREELQNRTRLNLLGNRFEEPLTNALKEAATLKRSKTTFNSIIITPITRFLITFTKPLKSFIYIYSIYPSAGIPTLIAWAMLRI